MVDDVEACDSVEAFDAQADSRALSAHTLLDSIRIEKWRFGSLEREVERKLGLPTEHTSSEEAAYFSQHGTYPKRDISKDIYIEIRFFLWAQGRHWEKVPAMSVRASVAGSIRKVSEAISDKVLPFFQRQYGNQFVFGDGRVGLYETMSATMPPRFSTYDPEVYSEWFNRNIVHGRRMFYQVDIHRDVSVSTQRGLEAV